MRLTDFIIGYEPLSGPSLKVSYGNYTLYTMGRASGGPVLAEILNILHGSSSEFLSFYPLKT